MIELDNIYLDVEAADYKEVLRKIGSILQEKGYVKDTYTDALMEREEKSPTGLPIIPRSIAIPHTDPCHVIKPCVIIFQLKNTVKFKEMANPENYVDAAYVFGLVFTDGRKQLPLLSSVITLAQDEDDMEKLMNAVDKESIYAIVKKYISE
ncbi:MAG: PTS sugar transporter subunit IIA [Eubacteriales bacterium]|nr:PTS sugar transporter subunit IIA [Eubacteriales bacterium]